MLTCPFLASDSFLSSSGSHNSLFLYITVFKAFALDSRIFPAPRTTSEHPLFLLYSPLETRAFVLRFEEGFWCQSETRKKRDIAALRSSSGMLSIRRRTRCARHHRARSWLGNNHQNKKVPPFRERYIKRRSTTNHRDARDERREKRPRRKGTTTEDAPSLSRDLKLVLVRNGVVRGITFFILFCVKECKKCKKCWKE